MIKNIVKKQETGPALLVNAQQIAGSGLTANSPDHSRARR